MSTMVSMNGCNLVRMYNWAIENNNKITQIKSNDKFTFSYECFV